MNGLARRIGRIEKEIGRDKDKPVWLRLPDPKNPDKTIEFVGYRTLTDLIVKANQAQEGQYDQEY
jgi:hypothetical protein